MTHLFFCIVSVFIVLPCTYNLSVGVGFRDVNIKTNLEIFPGVLNFKHEYLREISDASNIDNYRCVLYDITQHCRYLLFLISVNVYYRSAVYD